MDDKLTDKLIKEGLVNNTHMVVCPKCEHEFSLELKCTRCKHKWRPRTDKLPTVCPNPKCKSPYWNKPYKKKKEDEDE